MIIFLYGPNSYLRQKKLREILVEFEKKNGILGRGIFNLEIPGAVSALKDFCQSRSLFAAKRLAVVSGTFASADAQQFKLFLKGDAAEDEDAVVILNEATKPPAPFSFVLKNARLSQSFDELTGKQLDEFIKDEAAARGRNLTSGESSDLKARWGGDLWGLTTEIEKISLGGKSPKEASAPDFYGLVNSLKYGGDLKKKTVALERLLDERGDDAAYIFNMLGFGVKEASQLRKLAGYDASVKSGGLDYEEVLLDLVLSATY